MITELKISILIKYCDLTRKMLTDELSRIGRVYSKRQSAMVYYLYTILYLYLLGLNKFAFAELQIYYELVIQDFSANDQKSIRN